MEKDKLILIVAGEASGDLHAANLVREIKILRPQTKFFGLGGKKLEENGVDLYFNIVELAVVGLFEVLKNLGKFREIFTGLLKESDTRKPDLAILVDYPGFNLRLALELKKKGIPVIYYISPQVWAWGKERIKTIRSCVDLMLVVFKFEERLYKENSVPVEFVGHPLLDSVQPGLSKEELFRRYSLDARKTTFALLPGSREKEVKLLLPVMLGAAEIIHKNSPGSQFLILRSRTVKEEVFHRITSCYRLPMIVLSDMAYDGIAASDFAIVASGTATLETAILGVPMVILYKISFLTWAYLKTAIKIPYIGLVNVIRQKKFIEEFIQYDATPKKVSRYVLSAVADRQKINSIKEDLKRVAGTLGEKGASKRAAEAVVDFLNRK
ncbi:MAG: lipid-A-disaccharide synthase [Candidatus Omnitrophica bacterium]|nr:lipid-A-disaccharide synthase [Candidatus Omnitrophota bacterium]